MGEGHWRETAGAHTADQVIGEPQSLEGAASSGALGHSAARWLPRVLATNLIAVFSACCHGIGWLLFSICLVYCFRSLPGSMPHCLEVLVALLFDDYTNIASSCQSWLREYQQSSRDEIGSKPLVEILEENIHNMATHLPRIIRSIGR